MLLAVARQRIIGAMVIGGLTLMSMATLSMLTPELPMVAYRSTFRPITFLVGLLSILVLLCYRKDGRRFVFDPSLWNWWVMGVLSSAYCGGFAWLLTLQSAYALALAHMPSIIAVTVLLMYRLEAAHGPVEKVIVRELSETE